MINILTGISNTAAALTAERTRMEVTSQNIANANTTRGLDGKPYQRQHVVFQAHLDSLSAGLAGADTSLSAMDVARVEKDHRPPRLVRMPGHPDADANGMVAVPDINIHEEWADYISASRAFEANLAVVKNARAMAMQTLSIGKA
ncbi:MAG: flagellar basal body rod protein FlgC [Verrucomicrobia bacterium]|nr:flagellar basal body rod protein FlgC [Verrucomicrobiota bacterium]